MKTKIFKPITLSLAGLMLSGISLAQTKAAAVASEAALSPAAPVVNVNPVKAASPASWTENRDSWTLIGKEGVNTVEKSKKISRSFNVDAKDKLSVKNQYGKVVVNTWAKNEIKVDIEIKGFAQDDAGAQKFLDMVTIEETKSDKLFSFETQINRGSSGSWYSYNNKKDGKETKKGLEINYTIYMPQKNPLDITNKYGGTVLPDFDGAINIDNAYGSFTAQKIDNQANNVRVRYGSANIGVFQSGTLNVAYGDLKLNEGKNISAKFNYSTAHINQISGTGSLGVNYGILKIKEFNHPTANFTINSSYSDISIKIKTESHFNFEVSTSYGGFHYDASKMGSIEKIANKDAGTWSQTKQFKGQYGKGSAAMLIIKSNYGSVKFE